MRWYFRMPFILQRHLSFMRYDTEKSVREIGDFLAPYLKINDIRVKIIAYRPMGVREEYSHFQVPGQDYLAHLADIMRKKGFEHVTVI